MKLAVQQTLLPGSNLKEKFLNATKFGFDAVEVTAWGFAGPVFDYAGEIKAAMDASGLAVSTFCPSANDDFVHPDPKERERRLNGLVNVLKLAAECGAVGAISLPIRPPTHLLDLSPYASERELITKVGAGVLKTAMEMTADLDTKVFLEPLNRYEAYYLRTVAQAASLCDASGSPRVKVMADLFHMNIEEANIAASLREFKDYVGHVHLADSNRLLPGYGHTDFVAAFAALQENGFDGYMALECSVPGDPNETLPQAVAYLKACWEKAS